MMTDLTRGLRCLIDTNPEQPYAVRRDNIAKTNIPGSINAVSMFSLSCDYLRNNSNKHKTCDCLSATDLSHHIAVDDYEEI